MRKKLPSSATSIALVAACAMWGAGCGSTVATSTGPSPTKCAVTLAAPADPVAASGATATVTITTQPECAWSAASEASWITGLTPASGQGSGQLQMQVAANPDASARQGGVVVNGQRASIRQDAAACRFELSSTQQSIPIAGGSVRITVTAAAGCAWTARANASWLVITSGTTGSGTGSVGVRVAPNSGTARTGSLVIAAQTVTILQDGIVVPPPPKPPANCTYAVSPRNITVAASGTDASSESVTAPAGCEWSAASNASWMSITGGASGSGDGTFTFSIAANTGGMRTGTLTIADQTVTVTQVAASSPSCSYAVSPSTISVPSTASASTSLSVTTSTGCAWTSASNVSWISITSGASGSGNGTVTFSVAANSGAARTGTLTVANQTVTVNQAAAPCSYSVNPTNVSVSAVGGTGTPISVTTTSSCTWTATSNTGWISILTGANGTGNGTVTYSVQTNTGGARNGTLTVAGQTVTISQSALCTYSISPTSQTIDASGKSGVSVSVATQSGCTWMAVSNASWITVTGGSSGTGDGHVTFTVAANNSGDIRTGTLTIAGLTFTVNQKKP